MLVSLVFGEALYLAHRGRRLLVVAAAVGLALTVVSGGEAVAHHFHMR